MAAPHVEPVFFLKRDVPSLTGEREDILKVCLAAERVCGRETIYGAQEIRGLFRVYPLSREARNQLLIEGMSLNGQSVTLCDKNPFILSGGNETVATKVWISDIPISVANEDIESALMKIGCVLRSPFIMEKIRNADGKLTRFCTGRRFVFISVPDKPLEKFLNIGNFRAKVYHKEQPKILPSERTCSRCLKKGHHVAQCLDTEITCAACGIKGHKRGNPSCEIVGSHPLPQTNRTKSGIERNTRTDYDSTADDDMNVENESMNDESSENDDEKRENWSAKKEKADKKTKNERGRSKKQTNKPTRQAVLDFQVRSRSNTPKRTRSQLGDSPDNLGSEQIIPKAAKRVNTVTAARATRDNLPSNTASP